MYTQTLILILINDCNDRILMGKVSSTLSSVREDGQSKPQEQEGEL